MVVYGGVWWCMVVYGWCIMMTLPHPSTCGGIGVASRNDKDESVRDMGQTQLRGASLWEVCGWCTSVYLDAAWCASVTRGSKTLLPIFSIATVRNMFLKGHKHSVSHTSQ
jgi:hypothetical protein